MRARALTLVVVAVLSACGARAGTSFSGVVHAESVRIGSTAGGRVVQVAVSAGERVRAGEIIVRFDDRAQRADLHAAQGRLALARAQMAELEAGSRSTEIARAQAQAAQAAALYRSTAGAAAARLAAVRAQVRDAGAAVSQARAALALARQTLARTSSLVQTGDLSRQTLDNAQASYRAARAQYAMTLSRLAGARADARRVRATVPGGVRADEYGARAAQAQAAYVRAGARPERLAQGSAAVAIARADVARARVALDETVVRTPVDGVVESIDLHPGDLVAPGAAAATVNALRNPYVRIYVPQRFLAAFAVGTRVTVTSDALAGHAFHGFVEQRDDVAQFTPNNVQTAGERADLTFGVKIRILDPKHQIYGGTTVSVAPP
ncbi:MAG: HlyD family secretion protein [Vulcanimicrobiaceae bacterium]